jgi:hypothetical protein
MNHESDKPRAVRRVRALLQGIGLCLVFALAGLLWLVWPFFPVIFGSPEKVLSLEQAAPLLWRGQIGRRYFMRNLARTQDRVDEMLMVFRALGLDIYTRYGRMVSAEDLDELRQGNAGLYNFFRIMLNEEGEAEYEVVLVDSLPWVLARLESWSQCDLTVARRYQELLGRLPGDVASHLLFAATRACSAKAAWSATSIEEGGPLATFCVVVGSVWQAGCRQGDVPAAWRRWAQIWSDTPAFQWFTWAMICQGWLVRNPGHELGDPVGNVRDLSFALASRHTIEHIINNYTWRIPKTPARAHLLWENLPEPSRGPYPDMKNR